MAEIIKDYPPNIEDIRKVFNPPETVCFSYGDKIYNPSGNELNDDILVHESVHEKQQKNNPVEWWNKYLTDKEFRLEMEVEAYATQYNYIQRKYPNRTVKRLLDKYSETLATIYKLDISQSHAETLIRHKAKDL